MTPGIMPIKAGRFVPFVESWAHFDVDWTGAAFKLQVRDRKNGGPLRANLATVASAAQEGVRIIYAGSATPVAHIAAGRVTADEVRDAGYDPADLVTSVALTLIGVRINETTMEAMPANPIDVGADNRLFWDLHVTPSGGLKQVELEGDFTVAAGVTE